MIIKSPGSRLDGEVLLDFWWMGMTRLSSLVGSERIHVMVEISEHPQAHLSTKTFLSFGVHAQPESRQPYVLEQTHG